MRPIPQTIEAVTPVGSSTREDDLLLALQDMADACLVPDCTGLSIAWAEDGVTFTLVASEEEIAVLDALQYLDGGPCVEATRIGCGIETGGDHPLSEESWRLFAQASTVAGVRSTLSLPLTDRGRVLGSINLYGASDRAFEGHHERLAKALGAWAPSAVRNVDLPFRTRRVAEQAPRILRAQGVIGRAVGLLGVRDGTDVATAHERLDSASLRAGIRPDQLAEVLMNLGA